MANYLFDVDNKIHDITYEQINELFEDNRREARKSRQITESSYRGENYYDKYGNTHYALNQEYIERDPRTSGMRIYYPHGVVINQAERANFYRGENQLYSESMPTLLRKLKEYKSRKEQELYRLVADMRIAEFKMFLQKFEHVRNWTISDVLYEPLAQHYGLETGWLDITDDFNVAMFFATCYWDYKSGEWRPLTKEQTETNEEQKYGLIYHMPSRNMTLRWSGALSKFQLYTNKVIGYTEDGNDIYEKLKYPIYRGDVPNLAMPLGFQPFMRCSMQNGYGIYMREPIPLQKDRGFERLRFRHNEKLSQKVFEMMKGGELIYPHEGLKKAEFIIKDIAKATSFLEEAFQEALYRNHYYRVSDEERCKEDLSRFSIQDQNITIGSKHPWKLSANRRKMLDSHYEKFSVENYYGIKILDRMKYPSPNVMYEPWMLPEKNDGDGVQDFKPRVRVGCGYSICERDLFNIMYMITTANLPDF